MMTPSSSIGSSLHTAGYCSELFIEKVHPRFDCPICLHIVKDPKQCLHGHTFCSACIQSCLNVKKLCPIDRQPFTELQLGVNLFARSILEDMIVKCETTLIANKSSIHDDKLCQWIGSLNSLSQHLSRDCEFVPKKCPNYFDGCSFVGRKGTLEEHQHVCPMRLINCTHCKVSIKACVFKQHDYRCSQRLARCPSARTVQLATHSSVPEQLRHCPAEETQENRDQILRSSQQGNIEYFCH